MVQLPCSSQQRPHMILRHTAISTDGCALLRAISSHCVQTIRYCHCVHHDCAAAVCTMYCHLQTKPSLTVHPYLSQYIHCTHWSGASSLKNSCCASLPQILHATCTPIQHQSSTALLSPPRLLSHSKRRLGELPLGLQRRRTQSDKGSQCCSSQ